MTEKIQPTHLARAAYVYVRQSTAQQVRHHQEGQQRQYALEASRLARNNRDWHHLVDLCALTETLLIDYDGVYDPRQLNDRLLLGLKGTMSEFELGLLKQRADAARTQMIQRGAVLWDVPVGYVRSAD